MRCAVAIALLLAGCATKPVAPPRTVETPRRTVSAPVVQKLPVRVIEKTTKVRCVSAGDIPDEPPLIAGKLTGITKYDIGPIEKSARALRDALQKARALLLKCAGD